MRVGISFDFHRIVERSAMNSPGRQKSLKQGIGKPNVHESQTSS